MFKQLALIGALVLPAASAFAASALTINVQPGQGSNYSVHVPATVEPDSGPYALTGAPAAGDTRLVPIRSGQGDLVWIRVSD